MQISDYLHPGSQCQIETLIFSRGRARYAWVTGEVIKRVDSPSDRWMIRINKRRIVCRPASLIRPVLTVDGEADPILVEAERSRLVERFAEIAIKYA